MRSTALPFWSWDRNILYKTGANRSIMWIGNWKSTPRKVLYVFVHIIPDRFLWRHKNRTCMVWPRPSSWPWWNWVLDCEQAPLWGKSANNNSGGRRLGTDGAPSLRSFSSFVFFALSPTGEPVHRLLGTESFTNQVLLNCLSDCLSVSLTNCQSIYN